LGYGCGPDAILRGVRRLEHLLGVAHQRIQHRRDDPFRFDGVDEQQQPSSQGLIWRQGVRECSLRCGQLFHVNRYKEFFAR
jgi:hypothetical protein